MAYRLTITVQEGSDLDVAMQALFASDLSGRDLGTITITPEVP